MGRPRKFECHDKLEVFVELFWKKGYNGTSVNDLVTVSGVNRFNLYQSFGDKLHIYIKSLQYYVNNFLIQKIDDCLTSSPNIEGILKFIDFFWEKCCTSEKGCFLLNAVSEMAIDAKVITDIAEEFYRKFENFFLIVIENEKKKNKKMKELCSKKVATLILLQIQSLPVLKKSGQSILSNRGLAIIKENIISISS